MTTLHLTTTTERKDKAYTLPTMPFTKMFEGRTGYLYEGSKVIPIKKTGNTYCVNLLTGKDIIPDRYDRVHVTRISL